MKRKHVVRMSYFEREILKWGKTYINYGEMHTCNNKNLSTNITTIQGGITCGTIDDPRKSSKAIDERVIIDFRDKNVIIARFSDKNGGFLFYQ